MVKGIAGEGRQQGSAPTREALLQARQPCQGHSSTRVARVWWHGCEGEGKSRTVVCQNYIGSGYRHVPISGVSWASQLGRREVAGGRRPGAERGDGDASTQLVRMPDAVYRERSISVRLHGGKEAPERSRVRQRLRALARDSMDVLHGKQAPRHRSDSHPARAIRGDGLTAAPVLRLRA